LESGVIVELRHGSGVFVRNRAVDEDPLEGAFRIIES
jgi:DNA-binding GntR family transcriptional regulator